MRLEQSVELNHEEQKRSRESTRQLLVEFEQQLLPSLQQIATSNWQLQQVESIYASQEQALSLLAQSEYLLAMSTMEQVTSQSEKLIADWHQAFLQAFKQAQQAFNNEQPIEAELQLNRALSLKPEDGDALILARRIAVYAEVMELVESLHIATTEGDLNKQSQLIADIVSLDPQRTALLERKKTIEQQILGQHLAQYISQGLKAVDDNREQDAKAALQQASKLAPKAKETRLLASKVATLVLINEQQRQFSKLDTLVTADQWQQVAISAADFIQKFGEQAQAEQSQLAQAQDLLIMAQQINRTAAKLDDYISKPQRLGDQSIRQNAENLLVSAQGVALHSLTLMDKMLQLEQLISQVSQGVEITLYSDSKTDIQVIGVGKIGKTASRKLSLKPGNYIFEGRREGFRSVRVKLAVMPGSKGHSVEVVCHERI
jgi:hypothetical protein